MAGALLTDLYELNMAASYLRRGMSDPATFSLFVRDLPPERGFLVAAGLQPCLDHLEALSFGPDDLAYLRDLGGFTQQDLEAFAALRFEGDVWAVPEGRVVFAGEPLLEVTAPIAQAQLVETILLNQITLHTVLASKAARYRLASGGRDLVDFSLRRTHGVDAGMAAARSSAMVGFTGTSNVAAARAFGLRAAGTMAHSYVEAFLDEGDAFRAFAEDFPARTTLLVDTYETLQGVRRAAQVIRDLGLEDRSGVRLDSGDLRSLSVQARETLDQDGLHQVRIFASGGIDEFELEDLVRSGAPIDAFGIGTQLGVSADAPYLDTVYKLVEYAGRPVLKLSPGKQTAPGAKQVFRGSDLAADVLGLREENPPGGAKPLLQPAMLGGRRTGEDEALDAMRARFEDDLRDLPPTALRLRSPTPPRVEKTEALLRLEQDTERAVLGRLLDR